MAGRAWRAFIFILVPCSAVRDQGITSICFCSILLSGKKKETPSGLRVELHRTNRTVCDACHSLLPPGLLMGWVGSPVCRELRVGMQIIHLG